ncbi:MAG: protease SohB [Ectothiorhodospiraceae bacterium]
MTFVYEYGLFLAQTLTLVVAILVVASGLVALAGRSRDQGKDGLRVRKLNQRYRDMGQTLDGALTEKRGLRRLRRRQKQEDKKTRRSGGSTAQEPRPRVFVLRFQGDLRASHVESLREEVSAVLLRARPGQDQVIVCLESPGGMVHGYGLAASQLARLRERGIQLTAAVDRVAASGGYLMACVAHRIVAAPFAVVGSIGVVAQLPNFHRLLKRADVDVELHTAGEHKRTLTTIGENTHAGRRKFQEELETTHELFKGFVQRYRSGLDLEEVANGDHWYAEQAVSLNLVDALQTSDDLIMDCTREADVFEVTYERKQGMGKRLVLGVETAVQRLLTRGG